MKAVKISLILSIVFTALVTTKSMAVKFNSLSNAEAVELFFAAESKLEIHFDLSIDESKKMQEMVVLLEFVIGLDTLRDYRQFSTGKSARVKTLILEPGEAVKGRLMLHDKNHKQVKGIKGHFTIDFKRFTDRSSDYTRKVFEGSTWHKDDVPLFRILKEDNSFKKLKLNFSFTENFEYDVLYLDVKVISPSQGMVVLNKDILVNESEFLEFSQKVVSLELSELELSKEGSYYIQLVQDMDSRRINGISEITYEIFE